MTVHPRACGEHKKDGDDAWRNYGSSPRVRGTRARQPCRQWLPRFIPARAGNTGDGVMKKSIHPVHPRACGEHSSSNSLISQ